MSKYREEKNPQKLLEESFQVMEKYDLTDEKLIKMNSRDLRCIIDCASSTESILLKHRRRTIKNRNYAYSSRMRRCNEVSELTVRSENLAKEIERLSLEFSVVESEVVHISSILRARKAQLEAMKNK